MWGHVYLTQKEQNILVFNASKVNAFILYLVKYKWKYTFSMTSSGSLQFRWALFYPIFLSRKRCFELAVFQALPKLEILGPKLFHWHQSKAPLSSKLPVQPQPCLWGTQTDRQQKLVFPSLKVYTNAPGKKVFQQWLTLPHISGDCTFKSRHKSSLGLRLWWRWIEIPVTFKNTWLNKISSECIKKFRHLSLTLPIVMYCMCQGPSTLSGQWGCS